MEYWVEEAMRAEESEREARCARWARVVPTEGQTRGRGRSGILKGVHGQRLTRGSKSGF